jgi:C6 transcription factor Pro1
MLYEISQPDTPSSQGDLRHAMGAKSPESFALKFFTGCIIWFDTLSCVSTGSRSHLAEFHDRLLLDDATGLGVNIQLHTIAGCHNWVMRMIAEIASLSARKNERTQFADAEIRQLYDTAHDIQRRLELRHKEILEELEALRHLYGGPPPHSSPETYNKHTVLVVTNIFASAAAIYLHSIARSEVASPLILQALHKTIDAMRMIPDPRMVRGLVWPLCIAGCMASSTPDQEFFRNAAAGAVHDSRRFGNSGKALEILEMSWRLQKKRGQPTDCASTIRELGTCVLLV